MKNEFSFRKIQVNNDLWVSFGKTSISWGGNFLPNRVHYTISFPADNDLLNFHLTSEINAKNKPRLKIATVSKESLKANENELLQSFLNGILIPLEPERVTEYLEYDFFPFSSFEGSPLEGILSKELSLTTSEISNRKKNKIKIKGDLGKQFNRTISEIDKVKIANHITKFSVFSKSQDIVYGYIDTGKPLYVFGSINEWYLLNIEKLIRPYEILRSLIQKNTLLQIKWLLSRSLLIIQSLKTFEESQEFENPIHLDIFCFKK